jgi:F-type H+-transporting ATPase subunit b
MELITPEFGLIFWQLIVFGILFFLLSKFAWKPIVQSLHEREASIDEAIKLSETTRKEMAELKAGNEQLILSARNERDAVLKQAKEAADAMIQQAKADAQTAANAEIDKARVAFDQEKNAAVASLRKEAAILSLELAEKVLKSQLKDKAAQEKLVSEWISEVTLK